SPRSPRCRPRGVGQIDAALANYARAVTLEPDSIFARSRYGQLLRRVGRVEEAVREFREVLKRDRSFSGVHNELGIALAQLKRHDEAIAVFRTAVSLFPDQVDLRENLGRALLQ